ncbi:MAG: zinc-ribbon domain containing protein [Candidatus Riflebacteria bacterium]|nr:zinc-ribbon domain containing protein [Candidatus Riflebacteria bacterium]
MEDKTITCKTCGKPFAFTVAEQQFYQEKGFEHEPARCKACRTQRKPPRKAANGRQMHTVVCVACGQETQVPFRPTGEKPVYCRDCFNKQKEG